jgi:hypothetical protein
MPLLEEIFDAFNQAKVFNTLDDAPPNSLVDSTASLNVKTTEG